jgi:Effector-associated domain 1
MIAKMVLGQELYDTLREKLGRSFLKADEAIHVCKTAGLDLAHIKFETDTADERWDAILSFAEDKQQLEPLLAAALQLSMNNPTIAEALTKVRDGSGLEPLPEPVNDKALILETENLLQVLMVYDNADEPLKERLYNHLYIGELSGEAAIFDFLTGTEAGKDITAERERLLEESNVVLLLISPDFFKPGTPYLTFARKSFASQKRVIPVLLRDCLWGRINILQNIMPLPTSRKFVGSYPANETDTVLKEIAAAVLALKNNQPS